MAVHGVTNSLIQLVCSSNIRVLSDSITKTKMLYYCYCTRTLAHAAVLFLSRSFIYNRTNGRTIATEI